MKLIVIDWNSSGFPKWAAWPAEGRRNDRKLVRTDRFETDVGPENII